MGKFVTCWWRNELDIIVFYKWKVFLWLAVGNLYAKPKIQRVLGLFLASRACSTRQKFLFAKCNFFSNIRCNVLLNYPTNLGKIFFWSNWKGYFSVFFGKIWKNKKFSWHYITFFFYVAWDPVCKISCFYHSRAQSVTFAYFSCRTICQYRLHVHSSEYAQTRIL